MSFNPQKFINDWMGRNNDIDGVASYQCVDMWKQCLADVGYPSPTRAIGGSGGAKEIWYRRDALGYGPYFEYVQNMKFGDWCIWDGTLGGGYGHVAMFVKDNGNGTGQFFGQQQNYTHSPCSLNNISYAHTLGALRVRPQYLSSSTNVSSYSDSQLINEHAYATLKYDIQKRRDTPIGMVVETLKIGRKLEYTQKWIGNGHRYISWVEHQANGASYRYFVAVNGNEVGTEPWADFSPIEEQKPVESITLTQEDGVATFIVDGIRARYDSPTGDVCKTYNTGDSIRYYWKFVGNGHRYVVYKDGDRKVFVAVSATEDRSQMWATFEVPNEDKKEESKPSTSEPSKPSKTDYTKNVKGYGIDLSEHNSSDIDLSKYDFVILRANWWTTKDKKFEYFANKCEELNIPYGVYCYDYCGDEETALEQAKYTHELIKDRNIQLGVWMDMEDSSIKPGEPGWKEKNGLLTKEHCSMVCKVFCDYFKKQGYYTGVYTSQSWLNTYVDTTYPLWLAKWDVDDGNINSDNSNIAVMHQYTSKPFDKNVIYHDISYYKSNPIKVEEPKPEEPKDDGKENTSTSNNMNVLIDLLITLIKKILNIFK